MARIKVFEQSGMGLWVRLVWRHLRCSTERQSGRMQGGAGEGGVEGFGGKN